MNQNGTVIHCGNRRRQQRLSIIISAALVVTFLMQIAIYYAIDEQQIFPSDCGRNCPKEPRVLPILSIPSFGRSYRNAKKPAKARSTNSISDEKSMLIIGGSDGSGTRAIVETLRGLGTIVVSEDPDTFDVNAEEVFHSYFDGHVSRGWPSLVERFLSYFGREGLRPSVFNSTNETVSTNYCWPPPLEVMEPQRDVANGIEADVSKLMGHWNKMYNSHIKNKTSNTRLSTKAVTYAVKAPASMLVLPIFAYIQQQPEKTSSSPKQRLKFLHVLRDGRDVALSENQSPVIKFYNLTYPPGHPRRESLASFISSNARLGGHGGNPDENSIMYAKAMQLWNDWNVNVYRWGKNPKHFGVDIDYMLVRSEDLLFPGSPERLKTLTALARFVGSTISPAQLCELSQKDTTDYGQSIRSASHSIIHDRGGGGEVDILSRWESQNRDAEKRKKNEQQEQPHRRRLLEEKNIIVFGMATENTFSSVRNRYRKWKVLLENKSGLRDFFYREGEEGLRLFGYHPRRKIHYITDADLSINLC